MIDLEVASCRRHDAVRMLRHYCKLVLHRQ